MALICKNSIISYFLPEGQKKPSIEERSPLQELEVGPHSGSYLLVLIGKSHSRNQLLMSAGFANMKEENLSRPNNFTKDNLGLN